ncbi:Lysine exporter protein (LYSE/YGGA) [Pseudarthrobacter chlorophenolicus A6]|uniref:Lysine exporter protein (LYSE/YGGA) n=1 Tax=Pseudarthrobacter chlorophenolicus (strain ATCC 700700 / DSM 12829 / CIP 107037 / JCM 12360 / KCTC 9906 / NCIMB 13794 / A6) TaxID=452863 RepID=B8H6R3_PSECP|nr:LysE family transporter [Pseudarthrobacter chlorophenolicus]ACL41589.1 Lysine exporter protein (LYSE/YGGA) [Pseudarthrobacter chlorophenolicus A6]SDQ61615.1 homoserine/homoserine lactone efflux protein [Pseudarthrobacter chlorophenolicus]
MQFSLWLALAGAGALISFTPGAGAINTMSNSLNAGFRRSIWGILGQQAALIVHVLIVALGVGVLVSGSPLAFNIIRYAGAAYLVYLGIRQFLSKPAVQEEQAAGPAFEPAGSIFRRGFWVNLLNPKAIVFFLAFTPQFIRPEESLVTQYAILTATIVAIDILVMWFFFAAAARSFQRFTQTERGQLVLSKVFGVLFVGVGILLAFIH